MTDIDRNQTLNDAAKKALDDYAGALNGETLTKLGHVRRQALLQSIVEKPWYRSWTALAGCAAAVVVIVLALMLRVGVSPEIDLMEMSEDIDLLVANEDLEFIDELDFFQWMEEENLVLEKHS